MQEMYGESRMKVDERRAEFLSLELGSGPA